MKKLPRLLLTAGEPAGVGPDLVVRIAQQNWPAELVVIADPNVLLERARLLGLDLTLQLIDSVSEANTHQPKHLYVLPVACAAAVMPGIMNPDNAAYVIESLRLAAELCLQHEADAIVTGPVNKAVINEAGIAFSGHTEFFAQQAGIAQTVMLFVVDKIKIAIATTHLPLASVPAAITPSLLNSCLRIMHRDLHEKFKIAEPIIHVSGLNPHAGESGYLGREEIDVIAPVIAELNAQGLHLKGPFSADTIFTPYQLAQCDAVLAMFHDQALPVVKYMGFGHAVNVTLGLPFVRTSVDHGTALDIAGTDQVDIGSMQSALQLALHLAT